MMNDNGHLFYGGGYMWIFWILLVVGILFIISNMSQKNSNQSNIENDSPLEILKKRYARGEIEEEEFEQRRRKLER